MLCGDPKCHPHLVFYDSKNQIICDGVIDGNKIDDLWAELHRANAHIRGTKA